MWAASEGHREVVKLLVSNGANVSHVDRFGINILHAACLGGDKEVVKYILSKNTLDINDRVRCGRTAVMLAAKNGHQDVVELLVGKGANLSLVDKTGDNILHCACRGGDAEVVKYILSQEMLDINNLGPRKKTPVIVDINKRGWKRRTPVMVAAEQGHKEVVELLVKHGTDLSLKVASNLHGACYSGQFYAVNCVLSLNLVDLKRGGWKNRIPMMVAAKVGSKDIVEWLLRNEANLSLRDEEDQNILHLASHKGHVDVVKYVLSLNSVGINSRGMEDRTPVMAAAENGQKEVVELLVEHGANLVLCDMDGNNILHIACYEGHLDVVKYLLSLNSVDINSRVFFDDDTSDGSSRKWSQGTGGTTRETWS
ncbi:ankyrin repeat domain-containing protein 50-like [Haliotis asinina]|uniref:ankyrin repeat domain-containing protein 50-like n=1 Tax=Haliotis asinina TaxID=109174 RepID=UPI0035325BD4